MSKIVCEVCGTEHKEAKGMCFNCGAVLQNPPKELKKAKEKKTKKK